MADPEQFDLILISDSGKPYLVKMKTVGDGHEPASVEPLDSVFEDVPLLLRDEGTTLAIMPDAPNPSSGCTCTLLNMQSIRGAIKPLPEDPNRDALAKARRALRTGGSLAISSHDGKKEEHQGKPPSRK
jgi:hypothetical protein